MVVCVLRWIQSTDLILITTDTAVLEEVIRAKKIAPLLGARIDPETITVLPSQRGQIKQSLLRLGWPAEDFAGYVDGQAHDISLVQKIGKSVHTKNLLLKVSGMVVLVL